MLASPNMEVKSQLLSLKTPTPLKKWLIIRSVVSWLFHAKYPKNLYWELGLVFRSIQLLTQVLSLTTKKCCHVGIHVILGTPREAISPNFHALNVRDYTNWLQVTWNLELGTQCVNRPLVWKWDANLMVTMFYVIDKALPKIWPLDLN